MVITTCCGELKIVFNDCITIASNLSFDDNKKIVVVSNFFKTWNFCNKKKS